MTDLSSNSSPDPRQVYNESLAAESMVPLWTRIRGLVSPEPVPVWDCHLWNYTRMRPALLEAAALIGEQEADRRVLMMENPAMPGSSRTAPTLNAGWQVLMPGEVAPPHRHSIAAIRYVIEGTGVHTTVNGQRLAMNPGDFLLTPAWCWHSHQHEGDAPMIWLDGLDFGISSYFNGIFFEGWPQGAPALAPEQSALPSVLGIGLLPPVDITAVGDYPLCYYPYAHSREALHTLSECSGPDPHAGHVIRFVNPLTGGWAMPTIAATMRLMAAGWRSRPYRSTESAIFTVVEGRGTVMVGERRMAFAPHDTFVIPSWHEYVFEAEADSVLFCYSDRAAQENLLLFQERRG